MNPESIRALLDSNRYNIEILPQLELYVQHQTDSRCYDVEANLSVLKFYQFYPEKTQKFIIGKILAKALMNLPSNDFTLALYLLPEKVHSEEPVLTLSTLASLLESSHFGEFWLESKTCRELLDEIPGFDDTIRGYILSVISQTYRIIQKDSLSELINLAGSDLDAIINAQGWEQQIAENLVVIPRVEMVTVQTKRKMSQAVRYEDLSRILRSLSK